MHVLRKAWCSLFLILIFIVPLGGCSLKPRQPSVGTVQIVDAKFGLISPHYPGIIPTNHVPLTGGTTYGWVILVKTDKARVHWTEEFTLPKAPVTWGSVLQDHRISADGTTSIKEGSADMREGPVIYNAWSVAEGDPAGIYRIRVTLDDGLTQQFEFEVR